MARHQRRFLFTLFVFTVGFLAVTGRLTHAGFIIDSHPNGEKVYFGDAYKHVSSFMGYVGGENSEQLVTVTTVGKVDTGAGYANIKPAKHSTLTSVTFTPADGTLYEGFSFRGQLLTAGSVTVEVHYNQGTQALTFDDLPKNANFDRIGIVAGSGEKIEYVTISNLGFKKVKKVDFSYADARKATPTPVPEPATLLLLGSGLVGLIGLKRNFVG